MTYACATCQDTGIVWAPPHTASGETRRCPDCGPVYFTAAHVVKIYRGRLRLDSDDADKWLRWHHPGVADDVRAMVGRETAVQLRLFDYVAVKEQA